MSVFTETATGEPAEPVVDWARQNAVVLDTATPGSGMSDLDDLRKIVGDSRVVLLGDSRHDAREQWLLKHRMIEFLVSEMGFSVLALEESLSCTSPLNACLMGERNNLGEAQSQLGASYIWDTEEMLDLMSALVAHNISVSDQPKVKVFGFDISDGARKGVENALEYLGRSKPDLAKSLSQDIDLSPFSENIWVESLENYGRLSPEAVEELEKGLDQLVDALLGERNNLIAESSEIEYEWALRQAMVAGQAHSMMVLVGSGSFIEGATLREVAMTENLVWLLQTVAPNEKVIVWAHNFHVARAPQALTMPNRPPIKGMEPLGFLLGQKIEDSIVSIGFSFNQGIEAAGYPSTPEGWVDNILAQAGPDILLLDLHSAPSEGPVFEWLNANQSMRGQGGEAVLVPAQAYDALAFVRKLSQTRPR